MNIAMEQTEEYVNGQLKAKYGDTFIRGNNGNSEPAPARPGDGRSQADPPALPRPLHRSPLHQHAEEASVNAQHGRRYPFVLAVVVILCTVCACR